MRNIQCYDIMLCLHCLACSNNAADTFNIRSKKKQDRFLHIKYITLSRLSQLMA